MRNLTINTDYLTSWNSIFKILQLVFGTVCVGIIGNEFNVSLTIPFATIYITNNPQCFFLVVTSAFYISTFILFLSYVISHSAPSVIPKTIYEFVYHSLASILLFAASIAMMVQIHRKDIIFVNYKPLLAASICSLINTVLYICSAAIGFTTYGDD